MGTPRPCWKRTGESTYGPQWWSHSSLLALSLSHASDGVTFYVTASAFGAPMPTEPEALEAGRAAIRDVIDRLQALLDDMPPPPEGT